MKRWLPLAVGLGLGLGCAKKMLPPSPDRFRPRLEEVNAKSRVQVELVFDEPIDAAKLEADSFSVATAEGSVRRVRGVSQGRRSERVLVWTEVLEPAGHTVSGMVFDGAGNPARFRTRFRASGLADTIAPRVRSVRPTPGRAGETLHVAVEVTFSEPVDTAVMPACLLVPARYDTLLGRSWNPDWLSLSFRRRGVLHDSGIVYFLLQPGAADLEGNRTRDAAYTYFTPDSALAAVGVRGRVRWDQGPLGTGVVFFDSVDTRAVAPVLADGSFSTKLRPGTYSVRCVLDTNSDGLAELASAGVGFSTAEESLFLAPAAESVPQPIDAYRR